MGPTATPEPATGIGSTWAADAQRYDQWFDQPWGRHASRIECDAILAAAGELTGAAVADIGCGTGRRTAHLERLAAKVVALDTRLSAALADVLADPDAPLAARRAGEEIAALPPIARAADAVEALVGVAR